MADITWHGYSFQVQVGGHMPLVEVRVTEGYPNTQGLHDGGPTTTVQVRPPTHSTCCRLGWMCPVHLPRLVMQDCLAQTTLGGSLTLAIPRALSKQFANYWMLISVSTYQTERKHYSYLHTTLVPIRLQVLDLDVGRRLAVSMGDAVLPLRTAVQKGMVSQRCHCTAAVISAALVCAYLWGGVRRHTLASRRGVRSMHLRRWRCLCSQLVATRASLRVPSWSCSSCISQLVSPAGAASIHPSIHIPILFFSVSRVGCEYLWGCWRERREGYGRGEC